METKFTGLDTYDRTAVHAIKSDLTPALPRLNQAVCAEVDTAIRQALPSCDDWTEVDINDKLLDIVAKVSGRVFVGPDMCQDPEYVELARNYTVYLIEALYAIKRTRPWLRRFVGHRLPEVKRLRDVEKKATEFVEPIIRARLEAEKNDPNWQKPDDMVQWLIKQHGNTGHVSAENIGKGQLALIFAAIHTTTMTATSILYTLVSTPEYIEPLREEVRNAMHDNGGSITTRALQQMVKLDSYMKEVFRFHPPGISTRLTPISAPT
jgi:cytochrome P450